MTTVIIDDSSPQAQKYLQFTRTLPFATVKRTRKNAWEQAIDEDAVTVDEFIDELRESVKQRYRDEKR